MFCCFFATYLKTDAQKDLEIFALRSQLAIMQQHIINNKITKPLTTPAFRRLWIFLSAHFSEWKSALVLFKPETILGWQRKRFKRHWLRKSRMGRPKISASTIALIKQIHKENMLLSPEKIHERLVELAISYAPAPNTIAKYIRNPRKTPTERQTQSWKTFLANHRKGIWAMDFAVVPTLTFKIFYVLVIISHGRRKIEHFAVTEHPTAQWMIQQIREATPFGKCPEYLLHDNGKMFLASKFQQFLKNSNIKSKHTSYHSPWQNGICERLIGILRRELLDHIIPINQRHLELVLKEYVDYYNNVRTHQTLDGKTPVKHNLPTKTASADTRLKSTPILGGLYHDYKKNRLVCDNIQPYARFEMRTSVLVVL